jgi:sirohydrochlorin ferrochelatase
LPRLARALADHVKQAAAKDNSAAWRHGARYPVIVVDHGSPSREVAQVRDRLAIEVGRLLESPMARDGSGHSTHTSNHSDRSDGSRSTEGARNSDIVFGPVVAASMERRPGPAYDFCEPLLEDVFDTKLPAIGPAVIAMAFLSPGRHAGEEGDVADILRGVQARHPGLGPLLVTELLGAHPVVQDILKDRFEEAVVSPWFVIDATQSREAVARAKRRKPARDT